MITMALGKWSSASGSRFIRERIYREGYKWTPFCHIRWRYGWLKSNHSQSSSREVKGGLIMGEWHKHQYPDPNHPCTNCQTGSCGVTSEMRGGELWTKTDDCHETCELLREYNKVHKERLFGEYIREAYHTIKGS